MVGLVNLPVDRAARSTLRQELLRSTHTIVGVGYEQLALQLSALSRANARLPEDVVVLRPDDVYQMETGIIPIPFPVEVATSQLGANGLRALELLIEGLRQVRKDPYWPHSQAQGLGR